MNLKSPGLFPGELITLDMLVRVVLVAYARVLRRKRLFAGKEPLTV